MVPLGFIIDCRLASCPTRRSPLSVNATTDGVVRAPSALGMTIGSPPCQAAITELVVPRSIPTAVAIACPSGWRCHSAAALRGQPGRHRQRRRKCLGCSGRTVDLFGLRSGPARAWCQPSWRLSVDGLIDFGFRFNRVRRFSRPADIDLAGLARLRNRNRQCQHAAVILRRQLIRIEVVPEKKLPTELALRPLVDDYLVARLPQRLATSAQFNDVAFDGDVYILLVHARYINGDDELITTPEGFHRHCSWRPSACQCLVGEPVEFAERVESHESHCVSLNCECSGAQAGWVGPHSVRLYAVSLATGLNLRVRPAG